MSARSGRSTPGSRITPSRVAKSKSKYATNDFKPPTPVQEIASASLILQNQTMNHSNTSLDAQNAENEQDQNASLDQNTSPNQTKDSLITKITETAAAVAPIPSAATPLIQDNSGFSGDEEIYETDAPKEAKTLSFKHFSFKNLLTSASFKVPSTPATPQVSARVAEQLNQLKVDLAAAGELPDNSKTLTPTEALKSELGAGENLQNSPKTQTTPDISKTESSKAKKSAISRPSYKNRLQSYCRERLNFKKANVDVRLTEDAGQSRNDEATALLFKNNKMVINVPFRKRLTSVADQLGYGFVTLALHCCVFLVSFWLCNLLYTYHFPASEDERVNYFYELLTRQEVGSFLVHVKHPARWFVRPRFTPEMLAMLVTILTSSFIASFTKKEAVESEKVAPKIKLLKIC